MGLNEKIEVDYGRLVSAVALSFLIWGSGGILLKRGRVDALAMVLHIYLYFIFFWLFSEVWLLWLLSLPASAIGGAYFAMDLGRSFRAVVKGR